MDKYFKSEWINLTPIGYHKLFAFIVNYKGAFPSVAALVETNGVKHVSKIKGFLKYKLIELNENRNNTSVSTYETKSGNKMDVIYLGNNKPISKMNPLKKGLLILNLRFKLGKMSNL